MLFNSIDFVVFLPLVFILYWLLSKHISFQNFLLLVASYVFYGYWDWGFLGLILFSTVLDYSLGQQMGRSSSEKQRRVWLIISLIGNLGVLMTFKYFNFFIESFEDLITSMGADASLARLDIVLPVGISFYTFQTLSYTIDVYRGDVKPSNNFVEFATYVSFFPQLVAGPIERASDLLPQFQKKRTFDYGFAVDGLRQILFGFFKKMVIADNCAVYVNYCFSEVENVSSITLILGAIMFAFQIYGDFSGYSDIAIGTAKLFGFKLRRNFNYPYFSRDIAEFWRRWHISLSTWFRDYLYIPLGGSKVGKATIIRNTFIIFLVSGFWHGANWTFIFWGGLNALLFLPLLVRGNNRKNLEIVASDRYLPSFKELVGILGTFILTTIAWVFFRAENLSQAFAYLKGMVSNWSWEIGFRSRSELFLVLSLIFMLVVIEWIGRKDDNTLACVGKIGNRTLRWGVYAFILFCIGMFAQTKETAFIYFQF